jgi:hypothetical protein
MGEDKDVSGPTITAEAPVATGGASMNHAPSGDTAFIPGADLKQFRDQMKGTAAPVAPAVPVEPSPVPAVNIPEASLTPIADRLGPVAPGTVLNPSAPRQDISEVRAGIEKKGLAAIGAKIGKLFKR